jgi:putative ABC transport system permease protein
LRNLRRHKGYAFINVVGLAIGLALCALIYLYVHNELTYDRFHERADRIFRVNVQYLDEEAEMAWQPFPLAAALQADLPEVEATVRFFDQSLLVRAGEQAFEETIVFADPSVFGIFTFPLKRGNPATALSDPGSIVLSETAARKYFGDDDPMGRTVSLRMGEAYQDVVVTGVAYDVPGNASIRFDYLVPFAKLSEGYEWIRNRIDRWNASSFYVYALLSEQATAADVQAKMPAFRAQYYPDELARAREEDGWTGDTSPSVFHLQPLTEIHLDPAVMGGLSAASDPAYSYILAAIALAILGIACINFMTLAIGRSAGRAREIGVRKVVGAQRHQLMSQFWGEALLLSLLALGAGLLLAQLLLPTFNTLADRELRFEFFDGGSTLAVLVLLVLLVGLLAGSYPAVVLSRLRPIEVLRRRLRLGGANVLTRGLVVVQFALSIVLVVGTLVMLRQLDYLQTRNLGFDQEQVVVVPIGDVEGKVVLQRFQNALAGHDDIAGITGMTTPFTQGWSREGWSYKGEDKRA